MIQYYFWDLYLCKLFIYASKYNFLMTTIVNVVRIKCNDWKQFKFAQRPVGFYVIERWT